MEQEAQHALGGTRQSAPLDNETSYPLTKDEYLIIKENLVNDKWTNWESIMLATGISTLISGIICWATGSLHKLVAKGDITVSEVDFSYVVTIAVYSALALGTLVSFSVIRNTKKSSKNILDRLDAKITNHLDKINT